MKTLKIFFIVLSLISFEGYSQDKTQIHFFNFRSGLAFQKPDKSYITINNYTLVETSKDSLTFITKGLPTTLHFEKGKKFYFFIKDYNTDRNSLLDDGVTVEEVSEMIFKLTLLANKRSPEPYKKIVID
jgi:hypothetical protein